MISSISYHAVLNFSYSYSGAITRLSTLLGRPILWLLCLHHVMELIYGDACKVFFPTEGPKDSLYSRFEKFWASLSEADLEAIKEEAITRRDLLAPSDELTKMLRDRTVDLLNSLFTKQYNCVR